jgi:O-Antigen ligase
VAARLAISSVSEPSRRHGLARIAGASPGGGVVGLALPLLFLHRDFQPTLTFSVGSTHPQAMLSDFAVLAVVVAALVAGVRRGFAPLRAGLPLWAALVALAAWIAFGVAYGALRFPAYPTGTHAVSAAKWLEYLPLAPSLPLLLRTRRDVETLLWCLGLWSLAATVVGAAEFLGAPIAAKGTFGHRQASFLGSSDFAVLSGAALLAGIAAVAVPAARLPRVLTRLLVASGTVGMVVAGSLSALLGLVTALVAVAAVALLRGRGIVRRIVVAEAIVLVLVAAGSFAIRNADLNAYAHFLGGTRADTANPNKVQTYAHRTTLAWIGYRIWRAHPLLGVGWLGSDDAWAYMPVVPAAKKRFPNESPLAFPSPTRSYGVQLVYVQALADLGPLGLVLWLAPFAAALLLVGRALRRDDPHVRFLAAIAGAWTLFLLWCWTAVGFVAGLPVDALQWLALGLAATAGALAVRE